MALSRRPGGVRPGEGRDERIAEMGQGAGRRSDRPLIEYWAPVTQRREKTRQVSWFVGLPLIDFLSELQQLVPPKEDPYPRLLDEREWELVTAGLVYHRAIVLGRQGDQAAAARELEKFERFVRRAGPSRDSPRPERGSASTGDRGAAA